MAPFFIMLTIEYDAGLAHIKGRLPASAENAIDTALMWTDRSILYMNSQNSWRSGYVVKDPRQYCYDREKQTLPTGLLPYTLRVLDTHDLEFKLVNKGRWHDAAGKDIPDWAWPHQVELVQTFLRRRRCIIQSPTASGKSKSITLVIDQFPKGKCLVVVPSINLLNNIRKDLANSVDEPIGAVGGGKEDWQRITVATGRSLSLYAESKYAEEMAAVDVLIFDECHNFGNATGKSISKACYNTSYRLGLSATVTREDGSDIVLEGVIGMRALTIPDTVMVQLQVIHKPRLYFVETPPFKFPYTRDSSGNKPDRSKVYTAGIVENTVRNQWIVDIVDTFLSLKRQRGSALVLVERILHGELLQKLFKKRGLDVPYIYGSSGKERLEVIESFRQGDIPCIIASRILNEGEDVPRLELVVNAGGGSGKRGIIQKTGRGLRKDESGQKRQAIIVDFLDNEPLYLRRNSESRIRNIHERHPDCVQRVSYEKVLQLL